MAERKLDEVIVFVCVLHKVVSSIRTTDVTKDGIHGMWSIQ